MMKQFLFLLITSMLLMIFYNMLCNMIIGQYKLIHPIIMGFILFLLTIFYSLNIEMFMSLNWISYLFFLIIMGGLMIIFLYFISFISNLKISFNFKVMKNILIKIFFFLLFMITLIKNYMMYFPWYYNNMELNSLIYSNMKIMTMYMYMYNKNWTIIFCMIYLLIFLTFIVKVCINKKYSLRKIN